MVDTMVRRGIACIVRVDASVVVQKRNGAAGAVFPTRQRVRRSTHHAVAARDRQHLASDVAGDLAGGDEGDSVSNILRLADFPQRIVLGNLRLLLLGELLGAPCLPHRRRAGRTPNRRRHSRHTPAQLSRNRCPRRRASNLPRLLGARFVRMDKPSRFVSLRTTKLALAVAKIAFPFISRSAGVER